MLSTLEMPAEQRKELVGDLMRTQTRIEATLTALERLAHIANHSGAAWCVTNKKLRSVLGDLGVAEILPDVRIILQERLEVALAAPDRHGRS